MSDYIKREDVYYALQYLLRKQDHPKEIKTTKDVIADSIFNTIESTIDYVKKAVGGLPVVDVRENVRGTWLEKEVYDGDYAYECSVCGETWDLIEGTPKDNNMNYCPNCGAYNRGEKNERIG